MAADEQWRHLTDDEVQLLRRQQNGADDWNNVRVSSGFCAEKVRHCRFQGKVLIGDDVELTGIRHAADCRFDNGCQVEDVYSIGASHEARRPFRFDIDVRNEDASHRIVASPDMSAAGAYLMSECGKKSPEYERLASLKSDFENNAADMIGYIGKNARVEHAGRLENAWIGEGAVLEDCTSLKNVFVHSSVEEPAFVGANAVLSDVIMGNGCRVGTGATARNVLLGCHVSLSDYVRASHCVVGDNADMAGCEVSNAMVFPFHEQHHSSSFLIASLLKGQSNMAAGATVGSNHNGRNADCGLTAGRGFWPGLCTSVKFPSCFASYSLLAKGAYPHEIRSPFPFALLNNNTAADELEIMPAYWWMYNTYALFRNAWKFARRDRRQVYAQNIHCRPLAPDTVTEILEAVTLLEQYAATRRLDFEIEHSKRKVRLLKADEALTAYREMLLCYVLETLHPLFANAGQSTEHMNELLHELGRDVARPEWENVGGQLVLVQDKDVILRDLRSGTIASWRDFHVRMNELNGKYEADNRKMAVCVLHQLSGGSSVTMSSVKTLMSEAVAAARQACQRALDERGRDRELRLRYSRLHDANGPEDTAMLADDDNRDDVAALLERQLEHVFPKLTAFYAAP